MNETTLQLVQIKPVSMYEKFCQPKLLWLPCHVNTINNHGLCTKPQMVVGLNNSTSLVGTGQSQRVSKILKYPNF